MRNLIGSSEPSAEPDFGNAEPCANLIRQRRIRFEPFRPQARSGSQKWPGCTRAIHSASSARRRGPSRGSTAARSASSFGRACLRLEEQHDLRPRVRDAVGGVLDQRVVRERDRSVAPRDPAAAGARLAEDVDAPYVRGPVEAPRLVRRRASARRAPATGFRRCPALTTWKSSSPSAAATSPNALCRHADLEVLVLAALLAEEEVDRPAGRDVPRSVDVLQPHGRLRGRPRVPLRIVRVHRSNLASEHGRERDAARRRLRRAAREDDRLTGTRLP